MADGTYLYSPTDAKAIIGHLSRERFQTYRAGVGVTDDISGLRLYVWNMALAGRLYGPVHLLEVTLRNAIHERLSAKHGANWWDLMELRSSEMNKVRSARQKLEDRGKNETPGRIVAECSLGFWVGLFGNSYDPLWKTDLSLIFSPRYKNRKEAQAALQVVLALRNAIAHHEPILRSPMASLESTEDLLRRLSLEVHDWCTWHHRARVAFATAPHEVAEF